jgi:tRNA G18 (ribose-2'-O)-methylase SpoU
MVAGCKKEVRIYATALDGINVASDKKIKEGVIIIGNESKGESGIA